MRLRLTLILNTAAVPQVQLLLPLDVDEVLLGFVEVVKMRWSI
jgi:hypothetical protein